MPKSLFRNREEHVPDVHERFRKLIERLLEKLELNTRIDLREEIAALNLIRQVLSGEKSDESDRAGSAVRKYAPEFRKAYDGAGRRATVHPSDEPDRGDSGSDGGEPDEPGGAEDDPEPATPAA